MSRDGRREANVGSEIQNWIGQRSIGYEVAAVYSPESNGAARRLNRTFFDMARTILLEKDVHRKNLWAKAIHTASFTRNRIVKNKRIR